MSGRGRGRPSNANNNNPRPRSSSNRNAPHYELKRINQDTLSVHDLDTNYHSQLVSTVPSTSQAAMANHVKPGPKSRTKTPVDTNQLLQSIKADTAATRAEIQQVSQRTEAKFKSIDAQLTKANSDIKTLFAKVNDLKTPIAPTNIELHKQQQLRNNISISNIPIEEDENLFEIIASVLHSIGIPKLNEGELVNAKRIPNSKSKLIIVSFRDYELKLAVMKKKMSKAVMVSDMFILDSSEPNPRIYINNHLTPFYSKLCYYGRGAIANKQIHSSWVSSRGFLVKLDEDSTPIPFQTVQQFEDFLKSNNRVVKKKRERSFETDQSPHSFQPSKLVTRRQSETDSVKQMSTAAGALKISDKPTSSLAELGDASAVTEHIVIDS